MEQVRASERIFGLLRGLRPSQRVVQIGICNALVPALKATGDTRAEVLAESIALVCARFDSKGREKR